MIKLEYFFKSKFISSFILFFSIFLIYLPIYLDLILFLLLSLILRFNSYKMFNTGVFVIIFIVIISFLNFNKNNTKKFYREHEKWASNGTYKENIKDHIIMPYGDLIAMDLPFSNKSDRFLKSISEPRNVNFYTDEFGFRNKPRKIKDSKIILVGDSMIVGNGNDQDLIASYSLEKIIGHKVASIAYPSGPQDYESYIKNSLKILNDEAQIYVFYFEGNDFMDFGNIDKFYNCKFINKQLNYKIYSQLCLLSLNKHYKFFDRAKNSILKRIHIKNESLFKEIKKKRESLLKKIFFINESIVEFKTINNKPIAFHKTYTAVTKLDNLKFYTFTDIDVLKRVNGVFFIPTKFRVYSNNFDEVLSSSSFEYIKTEYNKHEIPSYDLTNCLRIAANHELKRNKFVYWRDDTHWNHLGIEYAMKCVAKDITSN